MGEREDKTQDTTWNNEQVQPLKAPAGVALQFGSWSSSDTEIALKVNLPLVLLHFTFLFRSLSLRSNCVVSCSICLLSIAANYLYLMLMHSNDIILAFGYNWNSSIDSLTKLNGANAFHSILQGIILPGERVRSQRHLIVHSNFNYLHHQLTIVRSKLFLANGYINSPLAIIR